MKFVRMNPFQTLVGLVMIFQTSKVQAQSIFSGENGSIMSTVLLSAACLVVTILAIILFKRIGGVGKDTLPGQTGLNLLEMKKRGLLTPEELEKVGQAIRRQMENEQRSKQSLARSPGTEGLLLDPEVRRLETLASVAKKEEVQHPVDGAISRSAPSPVQREAESEAESVNSPNAVPSLDDIVLPPDVQQLADAGILTPEEIENVKKRLLARQQNPIDERP